MAVTQQNQPPEAQINGTEGGQPSIASTTSATQTMNSNMKMDLDANMTTTSKRQRRPSVRLVEIGDQPAAALTKQWKSINKTSKTRPLTNLGTLHEQEREQAQETERVHGNLDNIAIGSWKTKVKGSKLRKRPRTNCVSKKIDDNGGGNNLDDLDKHGFDRGFEMEGSESPLKEQNPVPDSLDYDGDLNNLQFTELHNDEDDEEVELDDHDDDNGGGHSAGGWGGADDGVKIWLNELGLGRYWSVFEIHEVDEEVLPLLTLEDLKDMGISAVGSRRKLYCAIQKLKKGFS